MNNFSFIQKMNNLVVDYCEKQKLKFGTSYKESLEIIQELLDEIKAEYEELEK